MSECGRERPLLLVPTPLEASFLDADLARRTRLEICGFGPVVAAARAAALLERLRPPRAILVGIAGGFPAAPTALTVGQAGLFDCVQCHGIGVVAGTRYRSAADIGWQQWSGQPAIQDAVTLPGAPNENPRWLLSVCAASGSPDEALARSRAFPLVAAEDMEGFAVAAACRLAGVRLQIVRGISNLAGDRDHQRWQIEVAMHSATRLVGEILASEEPHAN